VALFSSKVVNLTVVDDNTDIFYRLKGRKQRFYLLYGEQSFFGSQQKIS